MRNTLSWILSARWLGSWLFVGTIVTVLIVDMILLARLSSAQKKYHLHVDEGVWEDNKWYVSYYKTKQYIQTIRGVMRTILVFFLIIRHNPNIFAGMAIALWAFVVAFSSFAVSIVMYAYLMTFYAPGYSVKIWNVMGEIISITPLYIKILGKNDTWEHTWELINIPNHLVRQEKIILVDLSLRGTQKVLMNIPFSHTNYTISFDEFLELLQQHLDVLLPTNTAKSSEHYKSYKWHKYKLSFDVTKDWSVMIKIWFLTKRSQASALKLSIISFIESKKS